MKKIFLVIAILIAVTTLANAANRRPFVWADDEAYWPAIYRGKNGKPVGIFNDILTEVFKRLDIPLKKEVYPWARAQKMVKDGEADGMVTVYTKERQTFTVATKPLWKIVETIFFRRDNPKACKILKVNSFKDLRNFTLVDTIGSGWTKEQYKKYQIKHIVWVPSVESAFNMLAKGRVDVFIMFRFNAYNFLLRKRAFKGPLAKSYRNIVAIFPAFAELPFRLLIRKDSPFAKKVKDINRVIEEMKRDGTYKRIREKYAGVVPLY